ncbi:MarR family winged helix-turn-helix transcriptional regulator [Bailinhaonella thermotolerans]|uniref:MarR family transcriptional regulator n=1 Tax=Bailinhaonella thermotolerans TaxID=1070861 RepID=A0A3A4AT82_9ACTN|nr:MarR family transcriptional regulator [Bailinhaonella thermotolerans]RJL32573.1 MarR family transcriptional regulator [Bailinhaonella thermotolerans]
MADEADLAEVFLRLTKRMRRAYVARLEPLGITPSQERALRVIAHAETPPRMVDLADRLGVVPRSVTSVVDALEAHGLVRREIDPAHRRSTLLLLTDRGREMQQNVRAARRRASEDLFAPLTESQRAQLLDLLSLVDRHAG